MAAIAAVAGTAACGGATDGSPAAPAPPCAGGGCTIRALATMQEGPLAVVANATTVFWARSVPQPDGGGGEASEIVACARTGCGNAPTVLAVDRQVEGLAVDATSLYWTDPLGTIMKVGLAGGAPTTLASGQIAPIKIVVDATNVYWTSNPEFGPGGSLTSPGAVMKIPLDGGAPTTLASNVTPFEIAVAGASVYWTEFIADRVSSDPQVMRVAVAGGAPIALAFGADAPQDLAVEGDYVYWTTSPDLLHGGGASDGAVLRAPIEGGAPTTIASKQDGASGIAVDGARVYWTNATAGTVVAAPLAGGVPTTLASGQSMPGHMAIDSTGVYWINGEVPPPLLGSIEALAPAP